jgi:hypothetical protein
MPPHQSTRTRAARIIRALGGCAFAVLVTLLCYLAIPRAPRGVSPAQKPPVAAVSHEERAEAWPIPTAAVVQPDSGTAGYHQSQQDTRYESLEAALASARYSAWKLNPHEASSRGAEFFSSNPAQQLRAWYSRDGIELASGLRTPEGAAPWNAQVRLRSFGRASGAEVDTPTAVRSRAAGSRIELTDEETGLVQWFENDRSGIEQGFTVTRAPVGTGPLEVLLEVGGTVRPELLPPTSTQAKLATAGVRLVDAGGAEVLHYTGLKAWDAAGRPLPARMELRNSAIALVVSDGGAQYPVTIDPLFASAEARLVEDNSDRSAGFANAVTVDADTAIVGANLDDTPRGPNTGSAYVFIRSGTNWTFHARLTAGDGETPDQLGVSVALRGNTAVIGAPNDTPAGVTGSSGHGSAYVFVRSGATWTQQAKLEASDPTGGAFFGISSAISGDTVVIGASGKNNGLGAKAGNAYVFVRNGAAWTQQARLDALLNRGDEAQFGFSVAISGETVLIGAPGSDTIRVNNSNAPGLAYVYVRSGTSWAAQSILNGFSSSTSDQFGRSVALDGDTALIGALVDQTPAGFTGSAYVYIRSGANWFGQAQLAPADGGLFGQFGASVSLQGNAALVGSPFAPGGSGNGRAYLYERSGTSWAQQTFLTASDGAPNDTFGAAVSLSGTTALIGAAKADSPAGFDTGAGYVFTQNAGVWSAQSKLVVPLENSVGNRLGYAVAVSGDTALVGAPEDDTPRGPDAGTGFVFVRQGTTWSLQAALQPGDSGAFQTVGLSAALDGDTAVLGAFAAAHVFRRSGTAWNQQATLLDTDDSIVNDGYGGSVAISGETIVVGANQLLVGGVGNAYIYVRTGSSWSLQQALAAPDGAAGHGFGGGVALSGETVLIGSALDRAAGYIFTRQGTAWTLQQTLQAPALAQGARFPMAVALESDTAILGTYFETTVAGPQAGAVRVFTRADDVWSQQAILTAADASPGDAFGASISLSGEMVLIGAPDDDSSAGLDTGSSYLFSREGPAWRQQAKLTADVSGSTDDNFGFAVALDGETAVIGANENDSAGTNAGTAYVFRVGELPEVLQPPVSRTVIPGVPVTFRASVKGFAPLRYQWRKGGVEIQGANGILNSSGISEVSYSIASVSIGDAGGYDVVISNIGGTATSGAAVLGVNALSAFAQETPAALPGSDGFLIVNLAPAGIDAAWRFVGEQQWRPPGVPVGGLATGDREVEFRAVSGFLQPLREVVAVASGVPATVLAREYFPSGAPATGGLNVTLKPESLTLPSVPVSDRAQWRLLGEGDNSWRESGSPATGLTAGIYLVECKPAPGRDTPTPLSVVVREGQVATAIASYFLSEPATGLAPGVLPLETVTGAEGLPYAFVGQLRSDAGAGTGFVVKRRVVATAGHVVFDDGTLAYATGLQWLFQRDRGAYEPAPQIPRGIYIQDGYATRRAQENTTGQSTPASQDLDAAAVYFLADAGRGGFAGFLASDAVQNEWLLSDALKTLVGYPVDGIAATNRGRVHATEPANLGFTFSTGHTFRTSDINSRGGNSGGPLCVQFEGGAYYPAAIYLGGTGQTVVRAIDSTVIDLFGRAEVSANGGDDNVGGGVTQVNAVGTTAVFSSGGLQVSLGAGIGSWRIGTGTFLTSGATRSNLAPGQYSVTFAPVAGYAAPPPQVVNVAAGQVASLSASYVQLLAPVITSAATASRVRGEDFNYQITANNSPTAFAADGEFPGGVAFTRATGRFSGVPATSGRFVFRLQATNAQGTGQATFTLNVAPILSNQAAGVTIGQMLVHPIQTDPQDGAVAFAVGALPAGLSLQPGGVIQGIPAVAGLFSVPISISHAGGTASATLTLRIRPSIDGVSSASGQVGRLFSPISFATAGAAGVTFSAAGLPEGLSINPLTGEISGTPAKGGTYRATITATNDAGSETFPVELTVDSILTVTKDRGSTLSGSIGGRIEGASAHAPGENIFLQASVAPGGFFAGWSGHFSSRGPQLRFVMPETAASVRANVRTLKSVAGGYKGLAKATARNGQVNITTTAKGIVTGKLRLGGRDFPIRATLNNVGAFTKTLKNKAQTVKLTLQADALGRAPRFTGTAQDAKGTLAVSLDRLVRKAQRAVPPRTTFDRVTISIDGARSVRWSSPGDRVPGTVARPGIGSARMMRDGALKLTGRFPGGEVFSTATFLTEAGWVIYLEQPGTGRTLSGVLFMRRDEHLENGELEGELSASGR